MKISTNSIGNYKPIIAQQKQNVSNVNFKKTEESVKITQEEKQFFTQMYPNEKENIDQYHYYTKDGNKNSVAVGSLFDRRG